MLLEELGCLLMGLFPTDAAPGSKCGIHRPEWPPALFLHHPAWLLKPSCGSFEKKCKGLAYTSTTQQAGYKSLGSAPAFLNYYFDCLFRPKS